MTKEVKVVEAYSFFEFCQLAEKAMKEGYAFDFDTVENCPRAFGSYLRAGMLKVETQETSPKEETPKVTPEVQQESKRGRKAG